MSEADLQASNITPPTASATPGEGETALTTSTSAAYVDLNSYPGMFNRYIDFHCDGADGEDLFVLFSSATTPAIDKSVTGATMAAGTTAAVGRVIAAKTIRQWRLDKVRHRYMHYQSRSGTPVLRMGPSSNKAQRDI